MTPDLDALREKYAIERAKRLRAAGVERVRLVEKGRDVGGAWY